MRKSTTDERLTISDYFTLPFLTLVEHDDYRESMLLNIIQMTGVSVYDQEEMVEVAARWVRLDYADRRKVEQLLAELTKVTSDE